MSPQCKSPSGVGPPRGMAQEEHDLMDESKFSAPARTPKDPATRLAKLEAAYAHELMSVEERLELKDEISRLRRKLGL